MNLQSMTKSAIENYWHNEDARVEEENKKELARLAKLAEIEKKRLNKPKEKFISLIQEGCKPLDAIAQAGLTNWVGYKILNKLKADGSKTYMQVKKAKFFILIDEGYATLDAIEKSGISEATGYRILRERRNAKTSKKG